MRIAVHRFPSDGRPPFCTDCVYATLMYPESAAKFYECGNPAYVTASLVDGSKTYYGCEQARRYRDLCGPSGEGFLAHTPEFKPPVTPSWRREFIALRQLWQQRRNLLWPSYWRFLRDWQGDTRVRRATQKIFGALCRFRERHGWPS